MLLTCCMMSGPFLTGYTQTINDYYDREIDAINEPYRPIPSGARRRRGWRRGSGERGGGCWLVVGAQRSGVDCTMECLRVARV